MTDDQYQKLLDIADEFSDFSDIELQLKIVAGNKHYNDDSALAAMKMVVAGLEYTTQRLKEALDKVE